MVNVGQQWAMMFLVAALLLSLSNQVSATDAAVLMFDVADISSSTIVGRVNSSMTNQVLLRNLPYEVLDHSHLASSSVPIEQFLDDDRDVPGNVRLTEFIQ